MNSATVVPRSPAELAPATLDHVILSGLRAAGRPVAAGDVARACNLDPDRGVTDRAQALARLINRGLIVRRVYRTLDARQPLFAWVETTVYEAIGGAE